MDIQEIHSVLQEAGISVEIKDLQTPTEEFVVYLLTEYLNFFNFNTSEILKISEDQMENLSHPELSSDVIKVINLHTAVASFCQKIFVENFKLTDLLNPIPKKTRGQIKVLFNFLVYVRNKMDENSSVFDELDKQQKNMNNMLEAKNQILADTGAVITEQEKKESLKMKIRQSIADLKTKIKDQGEKSRDLEKRVKEMKLKHQEAVSRNLQLQAEAKKLHEITTNLESKVVKSPEEYATLTKQLEGELAIKKAERQNLNDCITKKRAQLKTNMKAQDLVKRSNEEFSDKAVDTYKKLKETTNELDTVEKKLHSLEVDIDHCNTNGTPQDDQWRGHEQFLKELDDKIKVKNQGVKSQKLILSEKNSDLHKLKSELEHELGVISASENKEAKILKDSKEYINDMISERLKLRESVMKTLGVRENHGNGSIQN